MLTALVLGAALVGCARAASDADPAVPTTGRATTSTTTSTSTTSTTTTAPATTTTTAPPGPAAITLAFAGDLLPHTPIDAVARANGRATGAAYDFGPMLAPMAPVLGRADLAICHLEVPVAPTPAQVSGYPSFGAPPELVDAAAAAGYDGCSTVSNHALDKGRAGIAATLGRFDAAHLGHAGSARTAEEAARIQVYDVHGVRVAHLAYAYGFNGYPIPRDAPWAVAQIDPDRIRADAHRAREAGADLVVVSLHFGTEYDQRPSAYQRDVAGRILPSPDIDLIVGHHAHVVQPVELVGGTYVAWGLGNQLANQPQAPRRDGLTILPRAQPGLDGRWHITGIEAVPTYQDVSGFHVLPVVATAADGRTGPALRAELRASYERTARVVGRAPGVTIAPFPG